MSGLRAANRDDVETLAWRVDDLPAAARPGFAALICHHGLMRPQWWMRAMFALIRLRSDPEIRMLNLFIRLPEFADEVVSATVAHIRFGHDREDSNSVGGFSQREVDFVVGLLDALAPTRINEPASA